MGEEHPIELPKICSTGNSHPRDRDRLRFKVLKPDILLIGIFILAILIRLLYLNQIISTPIFYGLAADSEKYDKLATHILKGNLTHKDFIYLNPFYPFFLALIYLIFGQSRLAVAFIQGIIDSTSCIIIYYIAMMLFNKRVGIIAAFIYACYGIAIFYTGILLAPTVVIFFILLFIASLIFAEEKRQVIIFFISGILFGLAVLARPNVTLFLILLPLWFFTVLKNKLGIHKSVQSFLLLLFGFFMVISLVIIRNYSIEKRFFYSTQGGFSFYIGNNPGATGGFMSPYGISSSPVEQVKTSVHYAEQELGKTLTTSEASRYWLFKGLTFIKDNPLDAFFLLMKKCAFFWRKEEIPINIHFSLSKRLAPIFRLPLISFGIIVPFAILGIILSLKRWEDTLLVTFFIFSCAVSVIIFFISARYRLPIVPFLIIFTSYSFYRFIEMIHARKMKEIAIWGAVLIPLFIGINRDFKYFTSDYSPVHYNNLGAAYRKKGELDKAISAYRKALAIDTNLAEAHNNLGVVYGNKGMLNEAISAYKKALAISPNLAEAHNNLGAVYIKKGELDKAIFASQKALTINPNYAGAHNNLGNAYLKKGKFDNAILEFRKALTIDPDYEEGQSNLKVAYYKKDKLDKATSVYRKELAINPDLAEAHYNLGVIYGDEGILDEAISEYKKALAINPNLAEAYINLGVAYGEKGMLDEAITEYELALDLTPSDAEAYNNLGNARLKKGELDEAISAYKKALDINSDYADAHANLGVAYYSKENYKFAIMHVGKAKELGFVVDPNLMELLKPYR
jgi:tetratricopeptide (TPR) repeat protein